jgi:hypothetical protein
LLPTPSSPAEELEEEEEEEEGDMDEDKESERPGSETELTGLVNELVATAVVSSLG